MGKHLSINSLSLHMEGVFEGVHMQCIYIVNKIYVCAANTAVHMYMLRIVNRKYSHPPYDR